MIRFVDYVRYESNVNQLDIDRSIDPSATPEGEAAGPTVAVIVIEDRLLITINIYIYMYKLHYTSLSQRSCSASWHDSFDQQWRRVAPLINLSLQLSFTFTWAAFSPLKPLHI